MTVLGQLAGAVGVGGGALGALVAALWLRRALRVGSRLATWGVIGTVVLALFGVGWAGGYVDGARLLGDLWGLGRQVVDVALPVVRSLLAG